LKTSRVAFSIPGYLSGATQPRKNPNFPDI
jgi:hypothetical protein